MILALFIVNGSDAIPCAGQKGRQLKVIGPLVSVMNRSIC